MDNENTKKNAESFFKIQMRKAFYHGLNFEHATALGDLNPDTVVDENLPFSEWFNKYYGQQEYTEYLKVSDLIEILQNHDPNMPLVATDAGKGHQYMLAPDYIEVRNNVYFGNDDVGQNFEQDLTEEAQEQQEYLNIATI